jgi:hypothetical protein
MLRLPAISAIVLVAALPAVAADDDSTLSAQFAQPFKIAPAPRTDDQPPACAPPPCALQLPNDAWKRDATRRSTEDYLNADAVVLDRSRRAALAAQFIETPPVLETKIGDTSCRSTLHLVFGFKGTPMTKILHCGF